MKTREQKIKKEIKNEIPQTITNTKDKKYIFSSSIINYIYNS